MARVILECGINYTGSIMFYFNRHEVGFQENTHKEDINHGGKWHI